MGRPPASANAVATPERVLAAAEWAFAATGYGAAKLADIAKHAGIGRPSLLYHFGSKEALYAKTVERCFTRLREILLESMGAEGPFAERLDCTVRTYVEYLHTEPHLARIVLRELLDGQGPGRDLLEQQIVPLVDTLQLVIGKQGADVLRPDAPIRATIVQVASDALLRMAAPPSLREALWGSEIQSQRLARILLLRDPGLPEQTP